MAAGGERNWAEGCALGMRGGICWRMGLAGGRKFPAELEARQPYVEHRSRGPETCVPVPIQIDRAGSSTEFSRPDE